jgi:hypothetical protein
MCCILIVPVKKADGGGWDFDFPILEEEIGTRVECEVENIESAVMAVYYEGVEDSPPIAIPPLSRPDKWIELKFLRGDHALHTYTIFSRLS